MFQTNQNYSFYWRVWVESCKKTLPKKKSLPGKCVSHKIGSSENLDNTQCDREYFHLGTRHLRVSHTTTQHNTATIAIGWILTVKITCSVCTVRMVGSCINRCWGNYSCSGLNTAIKWLRNTLKPMGSIDDPTSLCKWILDLKNHYTSTLDICTEGLWFMINVHFTSTCSRYDGTLLLAFSAAHLSKKLNTSTGNIWTNSFSISTFLFSALDGYTFCHRGFFQVRQ